MKSFTLKNVALASLVALTLGMFATTAYAVFNVNWSLLANDPICPHRPGCHEQLHEVNMNAGTTYVIDMKSTQFDSYLYLENFSGQVLAQDDDSGGNLNARIIFTPSVSGTYRIVATSFTQGATGSYNVSVTP